MSKKKKVLIAVGGTGGHVFPGCNLADHLASENYNVELVTDNRGFRYLKKFKDFKFTILPSKPFNKKNIFTILYSSILIFYAIIKSILFLIFNRPWIVFGMGGYSSFPICLAATILKIKFIIYENNLILGKANKYLLPFADKIFVSFRELEGIPKKYDGKVSETGNIIEKKILNLPKIDNEKKDFKKLNILVLGGSQAAKVFAEILPKIFKNCLHHGVALKIYQHCLPSQNQQLKLFYESLNIECEIFNFSYNISEYFNKIDLAITRSGSSVLAELTNACVPFISVPLPSSAENHQLKNAIYYKKRNFAFLIEEKDLNDKLLNLIREIDKDRSILRGVIDNQGLHSDKNVYKNINYLLKKFIDEKN